MTAVVLLTGPEAVMALGAGLLQEPVVESPLPGGIATVVRFLFNFFPAWFQIAGAVLGVLVGLAVLWVSWRRRRSILAWIAARPPRVKLWLGLGAAAVVVFGISFGTLSWRYTQHDNGFCTGCHVMGPSFQRFTESEHARLECHDCHQQSIFASMRQVYLWVAERPTEIGPHAKVRTEVCARCHVTGQSEVWQRIASTAGHRTHLESNAPALAGVQCVTCHGVEVHQFAPIDKTCGQAGCHSGNEIVMGAMSGQTALHCTVCHRFTADVPALATRDSAAGTLVPGAAQCFSCHEMRQRVVGLDPARDPHGGACGMCHKPHRQQAPAAAQKTCASAGCHDTWRGVPFHVGANHRRAAEACLTCHLPHEARVDASNCAGCHTAVRARRGGRALPMPFDTAAALRRTSWRHERGGEPTLRADDPLPRVAAPKGKGDAPPLAAPPRRVSTLPPTTPPTPPDSFSHDRHKHLACITCHDNPSGRGRLTFAPPRGCQICHHQAPATSQCAKCHASEAYASARTVRASVTAAGRPPREREVTFRHEVHRAQRCVACHSTPATLEPEPSAANCTACHGGHHAPGRDCSACHVAGAEVRTVHTPPVEAHVACDACHAADIVAELAPDRAFCLTCHAQQREHQAEQACTVCHLQMAPDAFREHLRAGAGE